MFRDPFVQNDSIKPSALLKCGSTVCEPLTYVAQRLKGRGAEHHLVVRSD
jgi:hypothetical protein